MKEGSVGEKEGSIRLGKTWDIVRFQLNVRDGDRILSRRILQKEQLLLQWWRAGLQWKLAET